MVQAVRSEYNSNVHHHLISLIRLAADKWRHVKKPIMPTFLDNKFHNLFVDQSSIGWNNIVMGRFTKTWILLLSPYCLKPSQWVAHLIKRLRAFI
jgi:hypothetical protein